LRYDATQKIPKSVFNFMGLFLMHLSTSFQPVFSCSTEALVGSSKTYQVFVVIDLIWNVAPGNSDVSAFTVALIPMLASAPLIIPHGNQRNYNH